MLARVWFKVFILMLVGLAGLTSYAGSDGGTVSGAAGDAQDGVGGYLNRDHYDYNAPFWGGESTYEPYLGEYYSGGEGEPAVS